MLESYHKLSDLSGTECGDVEAAPFCVNEAEIQSYIEHSGREDMGKLGRN